MPPFEISSDSSSDDYEDFRDFSPQPQTTAYTNGISEHGTQQYPVVSPGSRPGQRNRSQSMIRHIDYHGSVPGEAQFDLPKVSRRFDNIDHQSPLLSHTSVVPSLRQLDARLPSREDFYLEKQLCHYCQLRVFPHPEFFSITIRIPNDLSTLPSDFTFISKSILRDGVERADKEFRTGCNCRGDNCSKRSCSCLEDMVTGGSFNSYYNTGPETGCLRDRILESRDPIFECHEECACTVGTCSNRVVTSGRRIKLEIFKTDNRGWAVRSPEPIQQGQFVDTYVGEIITAEEAQRRRDASDVAQRKDVYLFALDKFTNPNSQDERLRGPPYEVDGEFFSGPTRFINHSCNPNLRIFARVGCSADHHIHDLAFFATRDIEANEELTFDYVDGVDEDEVEDQIEEGKERGEMIKCLCGADNCRGFLW